MTSGRLPLYLIALVAAVAGLTHAGAAPLDGETCAKLESEQSQLESAGIEREMAKGPAWAKANLAPEKLEQVRRFIELQEQLLFRCGRRVLVNLPPEPEVPATGNRAGQDDDQDKSTAAPKSKAAPKAGESPHAPAKGKSAAPKQSDPRQKQPAAKPAAQPKKGVSGAARKASAKVATPPAAEPGVTTVEKRPPKPKVDDAFKAHPPDPAVNPFADQLERPAKQ